MLLDKSMQRNPIFFNRLNKRIARSSAGAPWGTSVLSISKIEATQGDSDGFYTEVYYLVSTDKGAYRINTIGFNAAPECAGLVPDSTYIITTRGTSIPYLGKYKNIIRVVPDWTKPI